MCEREALTILSEKAFNDNPSKFIEAIKVARTALEKSIKVQEILQKKDNAFDGQEFGATYSDLDNIIEEIREVVGDKE